MVALSVTTPASGHANCVSHPHVDKHSRNACNRRIKPTNAARSGVAICVLLQMALQGMLVQGQEDVVCPERVRLVPTTAMNVVSDPSEQNDVASYFQQRFTTRMSNLTSYCCPSGGQIQTFIVNTTAENRWIGGVGATCEGGRTLPSITYGYDGQPDGQPGCETSLSETTSIEVPPVFNATYLRGNTALFQLFGIGGDINSSYASTTNFACENGLVPVGFGAVSACNSLTDFKVVCAPSASAQQQAKPKGSSQVSSCSDIKGASAYPSSPIGPTDAWQSEKNDSSLETLYNPLHVSAADSVKSDCCQQGTVSSFKITSTFPSGNVGQIEATCSNGDILRPTTAGFNGSFGSCSPVLNVTEDIPTTGGAYNYSVAQTNVTLNQGTFQCPNDTKPVGYSAASSCTSVVAIQVYCKALGDTDKGSISGGAIAGIVVGVLAGLALLALLALFLIRRKTKKSTFPFFGTVLKGDPEVDSQYTIELTDSGGTFSGTTTVSAIPYSHVIRNVDYSDVVHMEDIDLPDKQASSKTLENLPHQWQVPLSSVKLLCQGDRPIVLGRGGYGVVYRAIVRRDQAAIKIVKGGGQVEQARLLHEITILERCKTQHIVQFLGYSISEDGLLLCMEYMSNGTLYTSLRRGNEFQWYNRGWQAVQSIAAGLFCLHELDVAHLDMKTPNILIGADKKVKIADLGLGKLVHGKETQMSQIGTIIWMSPEQLNEGICALASDVWSLSTIIWEVCTLKKPDRFIKTEEIIVPDEAPQDLVDLINDCRAMNYWERPTIHEICDRLDCIPHTLQDAGNVSS